MQLFLEQLLNGLQLGVTLLLMASGLTLVLGIMNLINLTHGCLFMVGAYVGVTVAGVSGSYLLGVVAAILAAGLTGVVMEVIVLRRLYRREHLDQILATFGLILFFNEAVRIIWGRQPLQVSLPGWLSGSVQVIPGIPYPSFRLVVVGVGVAAAVLLYLLVMRSRLGMLIRAGASNREMVDALGTNIVVLYTLVFGLGAAFAGLAGIMAAPFVAVQSGMGSSVLILTFVVIIVGGIGSIRGAIAGALLIGITDTLGQAYLPAFFHLWMRTSAADDVGGAMASMSIYIVMIIVLAIRPRGIFGARSYS
ncbi:MAG TPA: branched-chain amino acid ABC transporter permease [Nevskiaceae bacterium]